MTWATKNIKASWILKFCILLVAAVGQAYVCLLFVLFLPDSHWGTQQRRFPSPYWSVYTNVASIWKHIWCSCFGRYNNYSWIWVVMAEMGLEPTTLRLPRSWIQCPVATAPRVLNPILNLLSFVLVLVAAVGQACCEVKGVLNKKKKLRSRFLLHRLNLCHWDISID